jgi:hypothetical protein
LNDPIGLDALVGSKVSISDIENANEDTEVPIDPKLGDYKEKKKALVEIDNDELDFDMNVQLGDAFVDHETRPYIMDLV